MVLTTILSSLGSPFSALISLGSDYLEGKRAESAAALKHKIRMSELKTEQAEKRLTTGQEGRHRLGKYWDAAGWVER